MSLLSRAKSSAKGRLFSLYYITSFQQLNFCSTKTTQAIQKIQQLTNSKTQKLSGSSSSSSDRIQKQTGEEIVWPKPSEIPYQAKVANFVNLIGYVKTPVHFEPASNGKHFAAIAISQEISGEKDCLLIPVVFEGDLAHVVACHVKENNRVLVSGQLSTDPIRVAMSDYHGKFHVVAENLNFVEGFKRNVAGKKFGVSFSGAGIEEPRGEKIGGAMKKVDNDEEFNEQWEDALVHAKVRRFSGDKESGLSSVSSQLNAEKCDAENGESVIKKNDRDRISDLWRDLVKNSLLWWDYRDHKSKGLVKEKFPDFKHKATGDGLWIDSAPEWVLPGLGKLEFDVKVIKAKKVQGGEGPGERKNDGIQEDPWKNLVENPNKWWDNRLNKRFPNAPDFRHKETGEGLWVSKSPAWASSKLPPLKDG